MDEDNITITKQEYFQLKLAEATLDMLQGAGVDNWDWYTDALYPEGEEDLEEIEIYLRKEILGESDGKS